VLEAMAAGVPVVAAEAGALPETAGGAARLVAPEPDALRAALTSLLADPAERARLRAAGLERAKGFGWDGTARAVDALLDRTAAG
jgi:glycosyltransferase involved in cell wall biosynthesis